MWGRGSIWSDGKGCAVGAFPSLSVGMLIKELSSFSKVLSDWEVSWSFFSDFYSILVALGSQSDWEDSCCFFSDSCSSCHGSLCSWFSEGYRQLLSSSVVLLRSFLRSLRFCLIRKILVASTLILVPHVTVLYALGSQKAIVS